MQCTLHDLQDPVNGMTSSTGSGLNMPVCPSFTAGQMRWSSGSESVDHREDRDHGNDRSE